MEEQMNDVTIVLNSHNRPASLKLMIESIAEAGVAFPVLVVDSSNPRARREIQDYAAALAGKIDLRVMELPEPTSPVLKHAMAADETKTEFIQIYADDDAILPETISERARFLSENAEYSCCIGRQIYVAINDNKEAEFWYEHQGTEDTFSASDPLVRVIKLMTNWINLAYGTMRTAAVRRAYHAAFKVDPKGAFLGERLAYIHILLHGKAKLLSSPALALSQHKGTISHEISGDLRKTIFASDFSTRFDAFMDAIAAELAYHEVASPWAVEDLVNQMITAHLSCWVLPGNSWRHPRKTQALEESRTELEAFLATVMVDRQENADIGDVSDYQAKFEILLERSVRTLAALARMAPS